MEIKVLASSSKGNCYLINDSVSSLLIECGIAFDKIIKEVDIAKVDACLITHEHQDHAKEFKKISKYTKVASSRETLEYLYDKNNMKAYESKNFIVMENGKPQAFNSFIVVAFKTEHDAVNPFGFLIYSKITKERLLFATDTYYIKPKFKDLNYIMVECNYAKELINTSLSLTERNRLFKSHFELGNVIKFLEANDLSKVKKIHLLHLSDRNSNAKMFKEKIQGQFGKIVEIAKE